MKLRTFIAWDHRPTDQPSTSVGVLEDNFEVLGLGLALESRVLGLGLVTQVLGKTRGNTPRQSLHVLHKRLQGQQLRILVIAGE